MNKLKLAIVTVSIAYLALFSQLSHGAILTFSGTAQMSDGESFGSVDQGDFFDFMYSVDTGLDELASPFSGSYNTISFMVSDRLGGILNYVNSANESSQASVNNNTDGCLGLEVSCDRYFVLTDPLVGTFGGLSFTESDELGFSFGFLGPDNVFNSDVHPVDASFVAQMIDPGFSNFGKADGTDTNLGSFRVISLELKENASVPIQGSALLFFLAFSAIGVKRYSRIS